MNWLPLAIGILAVAGLLFLNKRSYRKGKRKQVDDESEGTAYRVYTTKFDQEICSKDLPLILPKISPDSQDGWLGSRNPKWTSAISESRGLYESIRPERSRLKIGLESYENSYSDVSITLLVDQSGSMEGPPIAFSVAAIRHLSEILDSFGLSHEILGFSTAGWKGGFARLKWLADGRPERPGRLCALSHFVYKTGEEARFEEEAWRMMLHPDILRENVDGEALNWAAHRLRERAEPTKVLLIMSDGAPVDDSTLSENGPAYLDRHVRSVIAEIESDERIILGAIGIGYAVDRYYQNNVVADDASQMLDAIRCLLEQLLRIRSG